MKQVKILTGQCSNTSLCSCSGSIGPIYQDAPRREGELSIANTSALYQKEIAGGELGGGLSKDEKREINVLTASSFNPALLVLPIQKDSNGPMHIGAGCVTHGTKTLCDTISTKEEGMSFWKSVLDARKEAEALLKQIKSSAEYQSLHKESKQFGTNARKLSKRAKKIEQSAPAPANSTSTTAASTSAASTNPSVLREQAETLKEERQTHAKKSKYGHFNQLIKGLEDFIKLLDKHTKSDSKKPRGKAGWAFLQSDPTSTTPQTQEESEMYEWLKDAFAKYEKMAAALFEVLKFLKSQKKKDPEEFKELVYQFAVAWHIAFPDKETFNKLHFLLHHIPEFVETWEMLGIVDEESFEALHSRLAKIKDMVKSMPTDAQRVATINARMQSLLKESILEITLFVEAATTGKKTGPQTKKRKRVDDDTENISTLLSEKTVDGEEFIVLTDGSLLPKIWKDIYLWFSACKAPKSWVDAFNRSNDTLSALKKAAVQFSLH